MTEPSDATMFWRTIWQAPVVVRVLLALVAVGLIVLVVLAVLGGSGGSDSGHITKAQYDQWRSECEQLATEELDTRLYTVGGSHWVDAVNKCLTEKASD